MKVITIVNEITKPSKLSIIEWEYSQKGITPLSHLSTPPTTQPPSDTKIISTIPLFNLSFTKEKLLDRKDEHDLCMHLIHSTPHFSPKYNPPINKEFFLIQTDSSANKYKWDIGRIKAETIARMLVARGWSRWKRWTMILDSDD
jgi:hypothetical protein